MSLGTSFAKRRRPHLPRTSQDFTASVDPRSDLTHRALHPLQCSDHSCPLLPKALDFDLGRRSQLTPQPAQALEEEHPQIASYLHSLSPSSTSNPTLSLNQNTNPEDVSALAVDQYTSQQTTDLLAETRVIMEQCERDGTDPDERLREVVERAVREGFNFGGQLGDAAGGGGGGEGEEDEGMSNDTKRPREDGA